MSVSTRTRFEIFKRDGFRCRYCGKTTMETVLHVDHVVPRAGGGTDDPENLITACQACNLGKSDVPLTESRLPEPMTTEALQEQTNQIAAYLEACREHSRARDDFRQYIAEIWLDATCEAWVPEDFVSRLCNVVERHGIDVCMRAITVVAGKNKRGVASRKYFNGVVRNLIEDGE